MVSLRQDVVIPTAGLYEAVGTGAGKGIVEELDFPYAYTHQTPFPENGKIPLKNFQSPSALFLTGQPFYWPDASESYGEFLQPLIEQIPGNDLLLCRLRHSTAFPDKVPINYQGYFPDRRRESTGRTCCR